MQGYSVYLALYTGIILLSANGLFAKGIPLDATSMTQVRSVIAAIGIALFLLCLRRSPAIRHKKRLAGIYFLGALMGLHWITYFHSMQISTVAIGMLSLFTFPVMTVLMEAAIHKTRPHTKDILSALIVLVGIGLMAGNEPIEWESTTVHGVLWGVLSAFFFASRNIVQKYYYHDVSSDVLMLHQMVAISILLLVFVDFHSVGALDSIDWLNMLGLSLVTTACAHTCLVIGYKHMPAKTAAMISCSQPAMGALLAWVFLNEQPTLFVVIGGSIILAMAVYESVSSRANRVDIN